MILIDAEALEEHGWIMHRTVAVDPQTMEWQTKKPTDFPSIDAAPVKHSDVPDINVGDLVHVVRCKDCKHSKYAEPGMVYCPLAVGGWVKETHFCADGERKDDETD